MQARRGCLYTRDDVHLDLWSERVRNTLRLGYKSVRVEFVRGHVGELGCVPHTGAEDVEIGGLIGLQAVSSDNSVHVQEQKQNRYGVILLCSGGKEKREAGEATVSIFGETMHAVVLSFSKNMAMASCSSPKIGGGGRGGGGSVI
jgi:hypothetical protein